MCDSLFWKGERGVGQERVAVFRWHRRRRVPSPPLCAQYLEDISKFNRVISDQPSRKQCIRACVDSYTIPVRRKTGQRVSAQQRDSVFFPFPFFFFHRVYLYNGSTSFRDWIGTRLRPDCWISVSRSFRSLCTIECRRGCRCSWERSKRRGRKKK